MHTIAARALAVTAAVACLAAGPGCSREQFRIRADDDVTGVITQKDQFPAWQVENWHVYPDPRARFAMDGKCVDFPPMPPDDYAAYVLSPNPQKPGRGGSGRTDGDGYLQLVQAWDAQNRAEDEAAAAVETPREKLEDAANPQRGAEFAAVAGGASAYLRAFDTDIPRYRLRLDQTIELAMFNSREFQDRREDLYLAALPVTLERFSFAAQAFATEQIIRESTGNLRTDGASNGWRVDSTVGASRRFATGGELMLRLANRVVVDFSNRRPDISVSTFGITFLQPFLRGGGFAVTLEALTQAERTLLYAMRSYMRFRRVFYYAIAGGGQYTNNPYGLQGFAANLGRGVGANLTANPVGYLPTILRAATLENERKNVATLEQFFRLFQNLKEGGGVTELQVVRVQQNLIRSRTTVLNSTRTYLDNIDNFKLQLGVPATLPVELDDTPLRPIRRQLTRFEQVYAQLQDVEKAAGAFDPAEPPAAYRERWAKLLTETSLARGTRFAQQYKTSAGGLQSVPADELTNRAKDLLAARRKRLDDRAERELRGKPDTPQQAAELDAMDAALDRILFEQALRQYEAKAWLKSPKTRQGIEQAIAFRAALEAGMLVAVQPRNDRLAALRAEWPPLPPVTVNGSDVLALPLDDAYTTIGQAALTNRLDLMNARAQVVDSWRQIAVQANGLQGVFNVGYNLDATTPVNGTLGTSFSPSRTRHQVILDIEPPLIRRAERNLYRAALISYQRQRRNLMAFEDNILTDARVDLRQLRQLAEAYALQQRAVELAYSQVDNARSTFVAPPDPASARGAAGEAAALTQQLLEAQSSLLQAQNDLYTTWTNFQTARIELYLDLELLPLDARGIWTDEPPDRQPVPGREPEPDASAGVVERLAAPRRAEE
ncbi:MAG: TolC family protein [Fimbriiglobus sp.]